MRGTNPPEPPPNNKKFGGVAPKSRQQDVAIPAYDAGLMDEKNGRTKAGTAARSHRRYLPPKVNNKNARIRRHARKKSGYQRGGLAERAGPWRLQEGLVVGEGCKDRGRSASLMAYRRDMPAPAPSGHLPMSEPHNSRARKRKEQQSKERRKEKNLKLQ